MNKRGRTKEDIFNVLKDRIVTLQYEPGKILNEIELSEEFGVSRTPIRTVFQQLESIKLVDIVPRYGVQVATLNFLNIKSLFEVTKVLDPLATKLAVSKLTDEDIKQLKEIVSTLETYDTTKNYQEAILLDEKFHKIVTKSCANPWLIDILTDLHCQTERLCIIVIYILAIWKFLQEHLKRLWKHLKTKMKKWLKNMQENILRIL